MLRRANVAGVYLDRKRAETSTQTFDLPEKTCITISLFGKRIQKGVALSLDYAISAPVFTASIGINTHLDAYWTSYSNDGLVIGALQYLGVSKVRDTMASPNDVPLFETVAAATGVQFDVYLSISGVSYDIQIKHILEAANILTSVEGINEADGALSLMSYDGLTGYAAIAAAQSALYSAIKSDSATSSLTVIGPSYGNLADFAYAVDTSNVSDAGNTHEFFGTGNPPGIGIGTFITQAALVSGNLADIATETGYYTGSSPSGHIVAYQNSGVSEAVQAKYDLTLLFDDWKAGIRTTYFYELLDEVEDPGNTYNEYHYGLFNADGTPKLAATAIHDLLATLADSGPERTDQFGYQIGGAPTTGNSLLIEKSTGVFDLAVWNDIRLASSITGADIANPAVPVTISFGQNVQSVSEYDPLLGISAVMTWSNVNAISLDLPDHPVIFEITRNSPSQFSLNNFVLPETVESKWSTGNLWNSLIANATEANSAALVGARVISVDTTGTRGSVSFNAATGTVIYTAPTYTPLQITDSFNYTLADAQGNTVTGMVAINETPAPNTLYDTAAAIRIDAPDTGWTLVSVAANDTLYSDFSGTTFIGGADTNMYGGAANNVFTAGNGNHGIGAGNNARITLGNGNNALGLSGSGNIVVTGDGNNDLWKSTGSTSITMGNGNQDINADGWDNVIRIGTGNSTINVGLDGVSAGNESVTVTGGTNVITAGGAGDTITVQNGTNNQIVALGSNATVTLNAGSSTFTSSGAFTAVNISSGTNDIDVSGDGDVITLGSGSDTVSAGGNSNHITAGSGFASITFIGQHDTIDVSHGASTVTAQGSLATIVLAVPGSTPTNIYGDVFAAADVFDLRAALASTNWDGRQSTLADYLLVRNTGTASIIAIDADGRGAGPAADIALLNNSANLTYAGLLAHAILPSLTP